MSQLFHIHPSHPQPRLIRQAVDVLRQEGVIIYPTDSCYALGCILNAPKALQRILAIRRLPAKHHFTLVCRDLSEIATYARVDNTAYRLLKMLTPGAYTFLLQATNEVPKKLRHLTRKSIGLRVPDHPITKALLTELAAPLMSTSMRLPGDDQPLTLPETMFARLKSQVDLVVDGGPGRLDATSIVDLTTRQPEIVRSGLGDLTLFNSV